MKLPRIRYADPTYWDERYVRQAATFDWFYNYDQLRRIIRENLSRKRQCLHVGCGNSTIQEGMAQAGYTVVNVDISSVVIDQMSLKHAHMPRLTYRTADCMSMPEFRDCSFGSVLDKGTVDALVCCQDGDQNIRRMFREIHRVLQPGGTFLLVTLGDPSRRLHLICQPEFDWKVSVYLLPKTEYENPLLETDGSGRYRPVRNIGPLVVVDGTTVGGLPQPWDATQYFYAYVCKKKPLVLTSSAEPRRKLPEGWSEATKEAVTRLQEQWKLPKDLLTRGRRRRSLRLKSGSWSEYSTAWQSMPADIAAILSNTSGTRSRRTSDSEIVLGAVIESDDPLVLLPQPPLSPEDLDFSRLGATDKCLSHECMGVLISEGRINKELEGLGLCNGASPMPQSYPSSRASSFCSQGSSSLEEFPPSDLAPVIESGRSNATEGDAQGDKGIRKGGYMSEEGPLLSGSVAFCPSLTNMAVNSEELVRLDSTADSNGYENYHRVPQDL